MKHNLAIKVMPLRIIAAHALRSDTTLRVKDLAELTATNYNTSWNRLSNLKKAKLITSTTRPTLTAMGHEFLQQHGKKAKCSPTKTTNHSAPNVLTTYSDPQKLTLIISLALGTGSLITLALQQLLYL